MPASRFRRITVVTDGSPHAEAALDVAIDLAQRYSAEITVLSVAPLVPVYTPTGEPFTAPPIVETTRPAYQQIVDRAVARVRKAGVSSVTGVCDEGDAVGQILGHVKEHPADLLVVGSRGLSAAKRLLLGSVSTALVTHAPCPVLVVRNGTTTPSP